jgi:hypothetical protein
MVYLQDLPPIIERSNVPRKLQLLNKKYQDIKYKEYLSEEDEQLLLAITQDIQELKKKYIFLIIDNTS